MQSHCNISPMSRLAREEQALTAHKPAAGSRWWWWSRMLPWSASAPLKTYELAEIVELAAATSTEHVVGFWLQQVSVLTGDELRVLRALGSALPVVPRLNLSDEVVQFVLNGWRDGAGKVEKW